MGFDPVTMAIGSTVAGSSGRAVAPAQSYIPPQASGGGIGGGFAPPTSGLAMAEKLGGGLLGQLSGSRVDEGKQQAADMMGPPEMRSGSSQMGPPIERAGSSAPEEKGFFGRLTDNVEGGFTPGNLATMGLLGRVTNRDILPYGLLAQALFKTLKK